MASCLTLSLIFTHTTLSSFVNDNALVVTASDMHQAIIILRHFAFPFNY